VYGQVFSHGRINDTLVGTTYVSLSEIARMNAMRVDPDEGNILTLLLIDLLAAFKDLSAFG
jgi:hypothetical protein